MGRDTGATMVCVGLARLPQPLVAPAPTVAVELEVDLCSRRIAAADTNLQFPCLERLLREVLVGQPVDTIEGHALLELDVRYSAPFSTALRAAVLAAARQAVDGARGEERTPPQRVSLPSA